MIEKIRHSVFETNSSSTHSICIAKEQKLTLPEKLHFSSGEFGWECTRLGSTADKASYLYTGCMCNGSITEFHSIVEMLKKNNIEVSYDEKCNGYVDHGDELHEFITDVSTDEKKLLNYLFSELSFIITGNDNSEDDVDFFVDYDHDYYYKGN